MYELGYLVVNSDDEAKILKLVESSGGEITDKRGAAQVKLAYPIQKHESAYFGACYFKADIPELKKIDEALKSDLEILRFILISRRFKKPQTKKEEVIKPKEEQKSQTVQPAPVTAVTNEALEEKLEEILK